MIETDAKSEAAIEMAQLANELQLTKGGSKTKKKGRPQ